MMRDDWVEIELGKVCDICDHLRKPINSKERAKRIEGKKISDLYPYYGATGQVGFIDDYLTDGEYVLIGEDGAPFFDYTKNIAYMINGKTWVNNHAHILLSKFNNKFLLHYLNQFNFNGFVSGTTRLKLTQGSLKKIPVKLAPLHEQRAIVAKIEKLFSDLDNGIAILKAAKAKLDIYRQAVLKKAFEGELTKAWREQRDLNGWKELMISQIGEIVTGNTPSKKNEEFYSSHDYNFYKPTDLEAGHNVFKSIDGLSLKGFENGRQAPENSILVTCIGATIGKTGLIKSRGCFNQQINAIIPSDKYNPKYVYYQAIGIDFQTQIKNRASSTTLPILNKGKFSTLRINVCSMEEQDQIVMEIETRLSVCDKLAESIDQSLEKSEALRQSILKKAFAGKLLSESELTACRREPDWEPAQKLLERIEKDKSGRSGKKQVKNK